MNLTGRWMALLLLGGGMNLAVAADVTREDAEQCRREIEAFHAKEIAYTIRDAQQYCDPSGDFYDTNNCASSHKWTQESIAADDVAWWYQGNEHCEGTDYPCYGPGLDMTKFAQLLAEQENVPPPSDWDAQGFPVGLAHAGRVVSTCIAKVWIAKDGAAKESKDDADEDVKTASSTAGGDAVRSAPSADDELKAANCRAALAKQDAEFDAMTKRAATPTAGSASGAKALYQMGMYVSDERLKLLDAHCKGQPEYAIYASTKTAFETARQGCRALASDGGESCEPVKLW